MEIESLEDLSAGSKKCFAAFKAHFGGAIPTALSFAPGRINLIGEHVDYMGGKVVPCSVDVGTYCAADNRGPSGSVVVHSIRDKTEDVFNVSDLMAETPAKHRYPWGAYVFGVLRELAHDNVVPVAPMRVVIFGTMPVGSGMSASASLCVALIKLARAMAGQVGQTDRVKLKDAILAQTVERKYCGVNCGIMDPYASIFGSTGRTLVVDCAAKRHTSLYVNAPNHKFILLNSMVKHKLGNQYNEIRSEMESAQAKLSKALGRDVLLSQLQSPKPLYDNIKLFTASELQRASYVVDEVARTKAFIGELKKARPVIAQLGKLLNATHRGLSRQLRVSTPELDFLQEQVTRHIGCVGARMMGGGFGGCVLALVDEAHIPAIRDDIGALFKTKFGLVPEIYDVRIGRGAYAVRLGAVQSKL